MVLASQCPDKLDYQYVYISFRLQSPPLQTRFNGDGQNQKLTKHFCVPQVL